ncbi:unnamed protein product [Ambrosiozyma monospora]|uniref:Unnamed protein product n=1 Tax=Ambrosiozyma monospora TaxID=43982 RepID=A0A9W7DIQ3_AMBMO|nr:unnamed protein product [Ambrosiozyma monospora]
MSWLFGAPPKKEEAKEVVLDDNSGVVPSIQDPTSNSNSINNNNNSQDVSSILQSQYLDPASLHPLAGLDKEIEYLDLDDEKLNTVSGTSNGILPSRGWTDDLCYGSGAVYVLGLTTGGLKGFNEGLKQIANNQRLEYQPFKLKLNTILNHVTKHGPQWGNSAGVLGIYYNGIDSMLDACRGVHDDYNSLASGFLSGLIFKCTKGPKAMGYSSVLMTLAAGTWCGFKRYVNGPPDGSERFQ